MPDALRPVRPTASLTAPRPLSVRDRLILDIARRGPDSALHLGGLLLFAGAPPSTDELAAHLAARVLAAPELTYRLVADGRKPTWAPDPAFDVSRHVHRLTVPGSVPSSPDATLRAVLDQPLDRDRPLWGVWLVEGEDDGFALCYRAHHAFQDGRAAAETLERLFGPPAQTSTPQASQLVPAPARKDWGLAVLKDLLPPLRRATNQPARTAAHWPALTAAAGAGRTAVTGSCDLEPLHAISRATRATVTQICLAAVTGALRAWHPEAWSSVPPASSAASASSAQAQSLRATFAISLRTADDPLRLLGNHGGVATVPLPCGEPSPLRHLSFLQRDVTQARLAALGRRHRVLFDRLPYWCGRLGLNRGIDPRYVPLTLADVRTRARLTWAGQAPVAVFPVPVSVPGQPLFVAWTTFGGRLHVTFAGDDAVPGLEDLPALWRSGLAALGEQACERTPGSAGGDASGPPGECGVPGVG